MFIILLSVNLLNNPVRRYNLPYNTFPTMTKSLISHFKMMKQLGRKPQPAMAMQSLA